MDDRKQRYQMSPVNVQEGTPIYTHLTGHAMSE